MKSLADSHKKVITSLLNAPYSVIYIGNPLHLLFLFFRQQSEDGAFFDGTACNEEGAYSPSRVKRAGDEADEQCENGPHQLCCLARRHVQLEQFGTNRRKDTGGACFLQPCCGAQKREGASGAVRERGVRRKN